MNEKLSSINNQKDAALKKLDQLLTDYISSDNTQDQKKAGLISYWIKDYCNYLRWESTFNPRRNKKYERGDIIQVNLGYNVGSELGGLHYAIVWDKHNALNSPVLTIIPLTSVKPSTNLENLHSNNVFLGNEIYDKLILKFKAVADSIETGNENAMQQANDAAESILQIDSLLTQIELTLSTANADIFTQLKNMRDASYAKQQALEETVYALSREIQDLKKIRTQIDRMKQGSIAVCNQITTVSKLRIYDPKTVSGVLHNIRLSPEKLDLLNAAIKRLYIYE